MRKKGLALGIQDFKKLLDENCYYVDKTKFIEDIFLDTSAVKLFIRPRRFGKTLNMSMLRYFFDVKNAKENRKLFEGMYIENSPIMKEQGEYPVIFMSLKAVKGRTFESLLNTFKLHMEDLFSSYIYLEEEFSKENREKYLKYKSQNLTLEEAQFSLKALITILSTHYNKPVVLLIDEYDTPLIEGYRNGYYEEARSFFTSLYSILKDDFGIVKRSVLTGIVKVSQAGIFSDLNNLKVNTILDNQYEESFGLLETEVEKALEYYEMKDTLEDVKYWYDGYRFGNIEVYNPWSIIKYLDSKELKSHWVQTSGNFLIKRIIEKLNKEILDKLTLLLEENSIEVTVSDSFSFVDENNMDAHNFWQLMLYAGYLTVEEKLDSMLYGENRYLLRIPNQEVRSFFRKTFLQTVFNGEKNANEVIPALRNKNIPKLIELISELVMLVPSYHDLSEKYENSYHMLIAGFIFAVGKTLYEVKSNREAGKGRADLILTALFPEMPSYILEFKSKKSEKSSLKTLAKNGYKQIEKKKYYIEMQAKGITDIVKIGIAFDGKELETYYVDEKK